MSWPEAIAMSVFFVAFFGSMLVMTLGWPGKRGR